LDTRDGSDMRLASAARGADGSDSGASAVSSVSVSKPPGRGVHSVSFQLNLSFSVHRMTQINS
jgi:hypothetical protein